MTALVTDLATRRRPLPGPQVRRRPQLAVIEGGRSADARRRRALYRRRRIAAALLVVFGAWLAAHLGAAMLAVVLEPPAAAHGAQSTRIQGDSYVVRPGDTMWAIAQRLPATGDVRDAVDRLIEVNGSAVVRVGQELRIPSELVARS